MSKGHILVVDDLPDVRATLSGLLSDAGHAVRSVSNRADALRAVDTERFDVAVLDVRLDETDEDNQEGLLLMQEIREKDPAVAIIILTGYANVKMVRNVLQPDRNGIAPAFGFLEKTEIDQLVEYVNRAFERATPRSKLTIRDLIAQGENDHVEFKSSIRWDSRISKVNKGMQEAIAIAVAGMLNSQGGYLLIGVADDGKVLGIERDLQTLQKRNSDGFQLALTDIIKAYMGLECMGHVHPHFESVDGKQICVVEIGKSPKPVFFATGAGHKFWVRVGNSTRSLDVKATMDYIQSHWGNAG